MRLIDADELIPSLKMGEANADTAYGDGRNGGIYFAIWRIGQMPTIDAAPVVRCKNCKHKVTTEDGEYNPHDIVCDYWESDGLEETDFCSYGERRQG